MVSTARNHDSKWLGRAGRRLTLALATVGICCAIIVLLSNSEGGADPSRVAQTTTSRHSSAASSLTTGAIGTGAGSPRASRSHRAALEVRAPKSAQRTATPLKLLNPGQVDDELKPADLVPAPDADGPTDDDDLDPHGTLADWFPPGSETYRTVCVRLCDGAMTPISFATTRDRFALDAARCRDSCSGPARLYVQRNPTDDAAALVDRVGRRYDALPTAFKFRSSYDPRCTCRAHAWEAASQARHRMHATLARLADARQLVRAPSAHLRSQAASAAAVAAPARGKAERLRDVALRADGTSPQQAQSSVDPGDREGAEARAADDEFQEQDPDAAAKAAEAARLMQRGMPRQRLTAQQAKGKALAAATRLQALDSVAEGGPFDTSTASAAAGSRPDARGRQAGIGRRRFDGTDWRISFYEPL